MPKGVLGIFGAWPAVLNISVLNTFVFSAVLCELHCFVFHSRWLFFENIIPVVDEVPLEVPGESSCREKRLRFS